MSSTLPQPTVFDDLPGSEAVLSALARELLLHSDFDTGTTPSIYVSRNFDCAKRTLHVTDSFVVGSGVEGPAGIRGMLRLCAPLARNGWHIFCQLDDNCRMSFGVFAAGCGLGPNSREPTARPNPATDNANVSRIWRRSSDEVVLTPALRNAPSRTLTPSRTSDQPLRDLVTAIAHAVADDTSAAVRKRLKRLFDRALGERAGTIVAVVPHAWRGGYPCMDATTLQTPMDLTTPGREKEILAASMIQEDGIIVFDQEARVRAYRWFVPFSWHGLRYTGGARERAFRALGDFVETGVLNAAFAQSSNGTTMFTSADHPTLLAAETLGAPTHIAVHSEPLGQTGSPPSAARNG